ncbi:glycosyltransferase family 39 protein [Gryllotalpicola koreensis]|uniref:Glycosyltransferase family 39 protein n=1 Tax=Gryllotalpicola koreensis TaxID=993086 RepID=A0ABP8A438_9MICO
MGAVGRAWSLGGAAAILSFAFSWVPSYWADEVATMRATMLPPAELLRFTTTHVDAGHTVYYLALHYWASVFGFGEASTRGFSAVGVGVATALLALIGQRLGRPRLALLAAALFALMPRMTWAGTEARSYAWTAALAAAVWLILLIALERGGWWWVLLGVVATFSVAVFLTTSTLLAAQLAYVLLRRRRAALPLLAAWLAALAAASPVLYLGWSQRAQVSWIGANGAFTPWTVLVEPWGETSWAYGLAVWLVLIVGAVRWRETLRRACPDWLLLAGAWVVVPFVITVGLSLIVTPLFTARYLTFAMPGFAMLLSAALASLVSLRTRRVAAAVAVALVLIAIPTYIGQRMPFAKPRESDLRLVAQTVHDHSRPGDAILFAPGRPREALYAYPQDFDGLVDLALKTPFPASGKFSDDTVPLSKRTERLAGIRSVLLVIPRHGTPCTQPRDAATLRAHGYIPVARWPTHREVVCRFTRD